MSTTDENVPPAISITLQVEIPSPPPSESYQSVKRDIMLPGITTLEALLTHIKSRYISPSDYLDPASLHIVWKSELKRGNTSLHKWNVKKELAIMGELAKMGTDDGRHTLVVRVKEHEESEENKRGAGTGKRKSEQHFNLAVGPPAFAAPVDASSQDKTASMQDVQFTDPSVPSSDGRSSQKVVRIEQQTWGRSPLTSLAPSESESRGRVGSNPFASDPGTGGRGGQQPRSGPAPDGSGKPGFWKPGGGWDSDAAARAHGPATPTFKVSAEPPRRPGKAREDLGRRDFAFRPTPQTKHVWDDNTLGDRPKEFPDGDAPPVTQIKSIFERTPGEKDLSESRWATDENSDLNTWRGRGRLGQTRPRDNQNRVWGDNQNWGPPSQEPGQNWNAAPQQGFGNPTTTPHPSQPQNWGSATLQPNQGWDAHDQSQGQGHGQGDREMGTGGGWNNEEEDQSSNKGEAERLNPPKDGW